MLGQHIVPHSEAIRAILLQDSLCRGGCPRTAIAERRARQVRAVDHRDIVPLPAAPPAGPRQRTAAAGTRHRDCSCKP